MIISEEDKGPKVSGNAAMTLRNFCTWQKKMNKNNDKQPDYWDTAILFTRQVKQMFSSELRKVQRLNGTIWYLKKRNYAQKWVTFISSLYALTY